jgi:two-component system CheB/CheR fusion protein
MLEAVFIPPAVRIIHPSQARSSSSRINLARPRVTVSPPHDLFVATLAHELRQPLATMLTAVEVVRLAPGTDTARRAADVMRRQLEQMSRLVDDLVDAARWAHGKVALRRARVDLSAVIADAAADVEAAAVQGGQMLVLPDDQAPMWVNGDRRRLQQVLTNLLGNAVKYTPPGGRIAIAVERVGRTATVRISDNGRGIEANALPHVFELFSQVNPHESTGLGIGLSIVREIVRLHGGRIEARSRGAGQGSQFIVSLPLAGASE